MENINKEEGNILEKPKNTNQNQVAGAILIAGMLIAGAIILKDSIPPIQPEKKEESQIVNLKPITAEDHIKGAKNAKITIVEYSDLECPFCKVFHNTMNTIVNENKNVAWVYRHFPITNLHKKAMKEAIATECAWEQGGNIAFWQYTDKIFEITTSNDGLADSELPKIAQSIGLNVALFNTCLESEKYKDKVQADLDSGVAAGVRGTPKSFILKNGKVIDTIDGAQPVDVVRTKIEEALR